MGCQPTGYQEYARNDVFVEDPGRYHGVLALFVQNGCR